MDSPQYVQALVKSFFLRPFRSRTAYFQLSWKEEKLKMVYGEPRDTAKLADDVYRALTKGGFNVERFQMSGKVI